MVKGSGRDDLRDLSEIADSSSRRFVDVARRMNQQLPGPEAE